MISKNFTNDLLDFLNNGTSMFHATENCATILQQAGFKEIFEKDTWKLEKNGKYFIKRNNSAIIAFKCPSNSINDGFKIIGSHSDSPGFKIKPGNCIITNDGYVQLNTEPYGGAILSTWFDRPLSLAGKVIIQKDDFSTEEFLIDVKKPILVIPNLCIHFNRDVNNGVAINKQKECIPLLCMNNPEKNYGDYLQHIINEELQNQGITVENTEILDYELYLYEAEKGCLMGLENEFISSGRIDDLALTYCSLNAIINAKKSKSVQVMACFDNEEVGSTSANGANSTFMANILERICNNFGLSKEEIYSNYAKSFIISADTGHAVHPNYSEKHDPTNRPILGGGPILKYSANQRYVTNSVTASLFKTACKKANVPYQSFVLRSDVTGGSTIGPAISSLTSIPTVDIGTAILAMHSIREFASVKDNEYTTKAFISFYED